MSAIKKTVTLILDNKKLIARRAVTFGSAIVGLVIADALLNKKTDPEIIIIESEEVEDTSDSYVDTEN